MATEIVPFKIPPGAVVLPENSQWKNRFEIRSETSDRIYTVAQNKKTNKWACSCFGWIRYKRCKHLQDGLGLSLSQIHGANTFENETAPQRKKLRRY